MGLNYLSKICIELRDPLISVDLFRYRDSGGNYTVLTEGTDFLSDNTQHPGIVTPMANTFWPTFIGWPSSAVLIRFTSGYAPTDQFWSDSGKRIKIGMMMLIAGWYKNRIPYTVARAVAKFPYGPDELFETGSLKYVG